MSKDIQGRRVGGWDALQEKGDFCIIDPGDAQFNTSCTGIGFVCPCCGDSRFIPLKPSDPNGWGFDGNRDRPTITPSIFFNMHHPQAKCHWHGYITAGIFKTV